MRETVEAFENSNSAFQNSNKAFQNSNKAFQAIRDMAYTYDADVGLSYASPVRGVWNIVHIGTLVPESHEIFVCPTSCLRGVVLTTAEMGAMDRLSTITVSEDNILEGDMEEALQYGTERILEQLPVRPRALLIYTSCIHHFLAVNYQRVYRVLREKYPDIDFIDCYMDPIMRKTLPVVPALWRQMHRLLRPLTRLPLQANLVGNCFVYDRACDLTVFLSSRGVRVLDVNTCPDYDTFLSMGASSVNFTFHLTARAAAKDMALRLGQTWVPMRPGYDYDEIDEDMEKAARALGLQSVSAEAVEAARDATEREVRRTLEQIGSMPVSIDSAAVDRPLELAAYLIRHGFSVESVFADVLTESEETFRTLQALRPDLRIYQSVGWNIRKLHRGHEGRVLAIGQKSAYFLDTDFFVNIVENDGMYGYLGIQRLMRLMREAEAAPKPMRDLVQIKGWGCSCT